jgi:hypothetical protein
MRWILLYVADSIRPGRRFNRPAAAAQQKEQGAASIDVGEDVPIFVMRGERSRA